MSFKETIMEVMTEVKVEESEVKLEVSEMPEVSETPYEYIKLGVLEMPEVSKPPYENVNLEVPSCECLVCNILENGFEAFNFEEKRKIMLNGRPTPTLNLTKQKKSFLRHFHPQNYKTCEWLTGCDTKSLLFCWPCLLFPDQKNLFNKNGFSNLNNFQKSLKRHSSSKAHIQAVIKEKTFVNTRIQRPLNHKVKISYEQHNQEVRKNRDILKRLIDVVCFLGEHELGFRGPNESENSVVKGNYVDLINSLAKCDQTLKYHLVHSNLFKKTSDIIQNDLIASLKEVVLNKVKSEIEKISFVAVVLQETTDDSNICQLSKILHYVTKNGDIKERCVGFLNISTETTSTTLYNYIVSIVNEFNCASKLVAQIYNGELLNSKESGELWVKLKEAYPNTVFIHCMAHQLHLVLQQSLNSIKACKIFFSNLTGIVSFFSKSSKRSSALDSAIHQRIPKATPIRWNYSGKSVQTLLQNRQFLIQFFEQILSQQETWDHETVICSRGYLDMLKTDKNFNFLLIIFSEIFPFCDKISTVLQNKTTNISACTKKLHEFVSSISSNKKQFDRFWNKFEQLNLEAEADQRKRMRVDKVEDEKINYHRLFLEVINNVNTQTDIKLKNFNCLKFLDLINFTDHTTIPDTAFTSLKIHFPIYFEFVALRSELSVVYNTSEGLNKNSAIDLWKSIKMCGLDQTCPEIMKLCELSLAILSTNTSSERSFSPLKKIENLASSSVGQERLPNLGLISIEKGLIQEMSQELKFYDDVIDQFAKRRRRIPLDFKF